MNNQRKEIYKIISNGDTLVNFIEWLPELGKNEVYYFSLFARRKYCNELIKSNDKTQLKRFTVRNKQQILSKIMQLELPLNRWFLRDIAAPQESLVLYMNPNPRCMVKATHMMGKKAWDLIYNENYNLVNESMSCIQKSKSKSAFVHFDIDTELEIDFKTTMDSIFTFKTNNPCWTVIKTRGGYHLLIDPRRAKMMTDHKDWHKIIMNTVPDIEQSGDMLLPVCGCTQGGFVPYFLDYSSNK